MMFLCLFIKQMMSYEMRISDWSSDVFSSDLRPYQAAVDRAQADLAAAKARVAYTGADLARARRLLVKNAIAQRDFEQKRNASRLAPAAKQAGISNASSTGRRCTLDAATVVGANVNKNKNINDHTISNK